MFCTKCGRPLHDGDKFCAYCGTKVREEDRQEVPEDSRSILFFLGNCEEKKRRKAMELLRVYLSE